MCSSDLGVAPARTSRRRAIYRLERQPQGECESKLPRIAWRRQKTIAPSAPAPSTSGLWKTSLILIDRRRKTMHERRTFPRFLGPKVDRSEAILRMLPSSSGWESLGAWRAAMVGPGRISTERNLPLQFDPPLTFVRFRRVSCSTGPFRFTGFVLACLLDWRCCRRQ